MQKSALVGRHLSIAGGIEKSFARAVAVGARCFQIFSRSSRAFNSKLYTHEEIAAFKKAQVEAGITTVISHAPYIINAASSTEKTRDGAHLFLKVEYQRAQSLGLYAMVLHPGSHGGEGEDVGIERVTQALNQLCAQVEGSTLIALETMAGQGSSLGSTLESLQKIYNKCTDKARIRFCLDTAHIFSAGYDISTGPKFSAFLDEFDKVLGLENLAVIHCNDSMVPFDARKDRHAHIGKGTIPLEAFKALMNEPRLVHVPKILETPDDDDTTICAAEIALMRSLVHK